MQKFDLIVIGGGKFGDGAVLREKLFRHYVHARISALRREPARYHKLVRILVCQRAYRVGVFILKQSHRLRGALFFYLKFGHFAHICHITRRL